MEVLDIGLGNIIFSAVVAIFLGGWLGTLLWGAILMLLEKGQGSSQGYGQRTGNSYESNSLINNGVALLCVAVCMTAVFFISASHTSHRQQQEHEKRQQEQAQRDERERQRAPKTFSSRQECIKVGMQGIPSSPEGDIVRGLYRVCKEDGTTEIRDSYYEQMQGDAYEGQMQATCVIKGNVSYDTGERIYHMPEDTFYSEVVIDESYGERWFCSEQEAQESGFRRVYN